MLVESNYTLKNNSFAFTLFLINGKVAFVKNIKVPPLVQFDIKVTKIKLTIVKEL